MTYTQDFLKKKFSSGGGTTGGSATQQFLEQKKKKLSEEVTAQPTDTTQELSPTDTKVGDSSIDIGSMIKNTPVVIRTPQIAEENTAYMGQGTLSTGQGVKIQQAPVVVSPEDIEKKKIQQADLVMGAEQMGKMYVDTLKPDEKAILIEGLKNKKVNQEIDYMQRNKARDTLDTVFPEQIPQLKAKDPNEPSYSNADIIANKDTGKIPFLAAMTEADREKYVGEVIAVGPDRDPRDPANFAYYEKQRYKNSGYSESGRYIPSQEDLATDDPLENMDIAMNIGKYGVHSTMGAMEEWIGGMIGSESMQESGKNFRKEADSRAEWETLKFNKEYEGDSLLDSRFWTQKVPQSIPFMVALAPVGIAGAMVGTEVAAAYGLGTIGTYLTTAGLSGLSSRFAEGMMEGAGTYAELKDKGVSESKASKQAWKTTGANMALVFSDITQLAITFAPTSKIPGLRNVHGSVIGAGKFAFDAASEGGEEVFQGYVQKYNVANGTGEKPIGIWEYLQSDEARETFKLGAATGLALGGLGVTKDAYDNFAKRAEEQVNRVEQAIEKNDIDFLGKMDVLVQKDVITKDTLDAVKTLINLKTQEKTGMTYDQWYKEGMVQRNEKMKTAATKVQATQEKTTKARASVDMSKVSFQPVAKVVDDFQAQTGEKIQDAVKKVKAIEQQSAKTLDTTDGTELLPYTTEQMKAIETFEKISDSKGKFLYTPVKAEDIEGIAKTGVVPIEGSVKLGANIEAAKVINRESDVMIRVNDKQKFKDLEVADIESGDTLFATNTAIPPENIEINTGNGWESIVKSGSTTAVQSKYSVGDMVEFENARGEKRMGKVERNKYNEMIVDDGGVQYGEKHFGEKIEKQDQDVSKKETPEEGKTEINEKKVAENREKIRGLVDDLGYRFFEKDGEIWYNNGKFEAKAADGVQNEEYKRALIAEGELYKDNGKTSNSEKTDSSKKEEEKTGATTQKTEIKEISEKAIAVVGYTHDIKDKLKEIGGKWNPKYKGWIFSKKRMAEVETILSDNNTTNDNTKPVGSAEDSGSEKAHDTEVISGGGDTSDTQSRNGLGGEGATSTRKVGKKGRADINEKAKSILEKREYSTDPIDYTEEELMTLRDYSGAGGKESTGAEGRGLLDEYYTPRKIVDAMWKMTEAVNPRGNKVLEPTVGVGRFIEGKSEKYDISAMELDKTSGTIAQILNPEAKVKIGDFQNNFMDDKGKKLLPGEKYDIFIGNPPYGARAGFLKGLGEESKIGRQEEYFIKRGVDMLEDGGVLSFIIPSSFLQNKKSVAKEKIVSAGGELVAAYRLPEGVFEDTSIGTDIIVIKKTGNGNLANFVEDNYFSENPQNIIGEVKERKNKYGRQEEYVYAEDKDAALKKLEEKASVMQKYNEDMGEVRDQDMESDFFEFKKSDEVSFQRFRENKARERMMKKTEAKVEKKAKSQKKPTSHEVKDVSGVRVVDSQVLNDWNATQEEIDIFSKQDMDGSVEFREEWAPYLNYFSGKWYHDINYFSGNIREKLEVLGGEKANISKEQYKKQEEGLMKIIPKDKTVQDINFDPLDIYIQSMETEQRMRGWDPKKREYFDRQKTILDVFGDYVREIPRGVIGHNVEKTDIMRYVSGDRARPDTKSIMGYIKAESKRFFNEFIKTSLDYETQQKIAEKYNREKNSYVRPKYDRIPVVVEGMAEEFRGKSFMLSETQKTGVGFLVNKGSGLIAYGVGVGKTHTLTVATKANMDKGWTKRPLFIVPGSTLEKTWIQTIEQVFPGMKINNLGGLQAPIVRQLKAEKGEDITKWINDGEISVITHDGILKLGFNTEELYDLTLDLKDALGSFDSNMTIREMQKNKEKIQEELGKAMKGAGEILFSELGFDHISVDEVHNFRKVFQGAKVETDESGEKKANKRFSNVSGGTPSSRARKLFLLSQAVQKNNGGRNVFLASATPFENHATEVYNILSFMARDRMKQMGIFNINDFFTAFANFQTEIVQKVDGSFDNKEIMKSFANLPELQKLLQEFIDYQEDPTLVRPDKVVLTPQLPMSEKQQDVKDKILEMLGSDDDGVVLKATTYAKSNSVSPFFVSEFMEAPESVEEFIDQSPKIKYTMEMIKELKSNPKTSEKGVFIYIGKEGVGFTDYYVKHLTETIGYKKEQIGVITGEVSIDDREKVKNDFNSGKMKVLIGGDPTKEGIDLQENGYATFNIALGWNPTEMAQVEGRVWRQGNKANQVLMVYPLVENSGDVNIYQKFEEKAGRINDLFSYSEGSSIFDVGELDPKEKKLMLLTDPGQKANLSIKIDAERISSELSYTRGQKEDMKKMLEEYNSAEQQIKYLKERGEYASDEKKAEYKKDIDKYKAKRKSIDKKLEEKQITSIENEIARLEGKEEELAGKVESVKLEYAPLVEKYQKELEESIARTKTVEQHKDDIRKQTDKLRIKTDEELKAEKASKVEEQAKKSEETRKYQTEDNWIYDLVGKKYEANPFYKDRVQLDESYQEAIRLAPAGWKVETHFPTIENFLIDENGNESIAYADLENKTIVINSTEARKSTAAHEVVHAALSELDGKRKGEIISISKTQWEKETTTSLSDDQAEEFLAEEFKYYIENQKYKTKTIVGRLREFISKLYNSIKGVFGKDNKVKTFYDDILAGKIVSTKTATGKRFQSAFDEKTQKMYDEIDAENFGYKYVDISKYKAKDKIAGGKRPKKPSRNWESFKEWSSDMLIPLDELLGNIAPRIKNRLIQFEYEAQNDKNKRAMKDVLVRLNDKLRPQNSTEEYRIMDMAMKNSDLPVIEEMAKKLGVEQEVAEVRSILEEIHKEARAVGVNIGYIENYFPRVVMDKKAMMDYIYGSELGGEIKQAIKLLESKRGHELTLEEQIGIANKLLRGFEVDGIVLTIPGNAKSRIIDEVNFDNEYLYHDSMEALVIYTNSMIEDIAARRLFGKGESLHDSIGSWTLGLIADGTIKPVDELTISRVLKERFADNSMGQWVNSYRSLAYLTTMGSPISAISQIQDLGMSFFENGIFNSLGQVGKAAIGRSMIKIEDLGIDSVMHELTDNGRLQRYVSKVFKLVGLTYMDRIGKQTMINGAFQKMKKEALAGKLEELDIFDDEATRNQVVQDLKNDIVSEDVKYLLFSKLCEYQPLTRSQMPVYYNTLKNGRVIYMLKTYLVKQLSVFRVKALKDVKEGIKTGNRKQAIKGAINFFHLAILLMIMGATADALKNLILNRPIIVEDMVLDNLLKLAGFSKYTVYQVREKTLSEGILSIVTPPFNFFNDIIVDAYDVANGKTQSPAKLQSINNIPLGGKLFYWWFGKGKDKSDNKRTGSGAPVKPATTKKTNPFSSSNAFKSSSSGFSNKNAWK